MVSGLVTCYMPGAPDMPESRCGAFRFGTWFPWVEASAREPLRPRASHLSRELAHANPGTGMTTRLRVIGAEPQVLGVIEGVI